MPSTILKTIWAFASIATVAKVSFDLHSKFDLSTQRRATVHHPTPPSEPAWSCTTSVDKGGCGYLGPFIHLDSMSPGANQTFVDEAADRNATNNATDTPSSTKELVESPVQIALSWRFDIVCRVAAALVVLLFLALFLFFIAMWFGSPSLVTACPGFLGCLIPWIFPRWPGRCVQYLCRVFGYLRQAARPYQLAVAASGILATYIVNLSHKLRDPSTRQVVKKSSTRKAVKKLTKSGGKAEHQLVLYQSLEPHLRRSGVLRAESSVADRQVTIAFNPSKTLQEIFTSFSTQQQVGMVNFCASKILSEMLATSSFHGNQEATIVSDAPDVSNALNVTTCHSGQGPALDSRAMTMPKRLTLSSIHTDQRALFAFNAHRILNKLILGNSYDIQMTTSESGFHRMYNRLRITSSCGDRTTFVASDASKSPLGLVLSSVRANSNAGKDDDSKEKRRQRRNGAHLHADLKEEQVLRQAAEEKNVEQARKLRRRGDQVSSARRNELALQNQLAQQSAANIALEAKVKELMREKADSAAANREAKEDAGDEAEKAEQEAARLRKTFNAKIRRLKEVLEGEKQRSNTCLGAIGELRFEMDSLNRQLAASKEKAKASQRAGKNASNLQARNGFLENEVSRLEGALKEVPVHAKVRRGLVVKKSIYEGRYRRMMARLKSNRARKLLKSSPKKPHKVSGPSSKGDGHDGGDDDAPPKPPPSGSATRASKNAPSSQRTPSSFPAPTSVPASSLPQSVDPSQIPLPDDDDDISPDPTPSTPSSPEPTPSESPATFSPLAPSSPAAQHCPEGSFDTAAASVPMPSSTSAEQPLKDDNSSSVDEKEESSVNATVGVTDSELLGENSEAGGPNIKYEGNPESVPSAKDAGQAAEHAGASDSSPLVSYPSERSCSGEQGNGDSTMEEPTSTALENESTPMEGVESQVADRPTEATPSGTQGEGDVVKMDMDDKDDVEMVEEGSQDAPAPSHTQPGNDAIDTDMLEQAPLSGPSQPVSSSSDAPPFPPAMPPRSEPAEMLPDADALSSSKPSTQQREPHVDGDTDSGPVDEPAAQSSSLERSNFSSAAPQPQIPTVKEIPTRFYDACVQCRDVGCKNCHIIFQPNQKRKPKQMCDRCFEKALLCENAPDTRCWQCRRANMPDCLNGMSEERANGETCVRCIEEHHQCVDDGEEEPSPKTPSPSRKARLDSPFSSKPKEATSSAKAPLDNYGHGTGPVAFDGYKVINGDIPQSSGSGLSRSPMPRFGAQQGSAAPSFSFVWDASKLTPSKPNNAGLPRPDSKDFSPSNPNIKIHNLPTSSFNPTGLQNTIPFPPPTQGSSAADVLLKFSGGLPASSFKPPTIPNTSPHPATTPAQGSPPAPKPSSPVIKRKSEDHLPADPKPDPPPSKRDPTTPARPHAAAKSRHPSPTKNATTPTSRTFAKPVSRRSAHVPRAPSSSESSESSDEDEDIKWEPVPLPTGDSAKPSDEPSSAIAGPVTLDQTSLLTSKMNRAYEANKAAMQGAASVVPHWSDPFPTHLLPLPPPGVAVTPQQGQQLYEAREVFADFITAARGRVARERNPESVQAPLVEARNRRSAMFAERRRELRVEMERARQGSSKDPGRPGDEDEEDEVPVVKKDKGKGKAPRGPPAL